MARNRIAATSAAAAVALVSSLAWATAVRHDRSDGAVLELGAKFPAVGQVLPDGGCTLVAPHWVITAAHVAASIPKEGGRVRFEGREYPVARIILHPEAKVEPGRPPEVDLAMVELASPVEGVNPLPLFRGDDELGRQAAIVGFGDIGDGRSAPRHADGRRRAVTNVVSDAGPRRLFFHFDEPPAGTDLEGVGAPGDSGGPVLLEVDGKAYVAGVSSASGGGKPGRYGVDDIYTRVSRYLGWIDQAVGVPAAPPRPAATDHNPIDFSLARRYFDEAKAISDRDNGKLWGKPLFGPMMFADSATRTIVADRADNEGKLRPAGDVFVGTLPTEYNMANTAFTWAGVKWTMVLWPPPADPLDRGMLLIHELWHRIQDDLGFASTGPANAHLDSREGRTWLRLEWAALRKALQSKGPDRKSAIHDALKFRVARRSLFPDAAKEEQRLEMHEGLANYTGAALAGADESQRVTSALGAIDAGEKKPTFVRSFAYASGPAYGVLLDLTAPGWRKGLTPKNDLGDLLSQAVGFTASGDSVSAARQRSASYGDSIITEETERDRKRQERSAAAKAKLVDGPVLRLPFQKMSIELNPDEVVPLDEFGTVYPTARIVDAWGVLAVTDGALIDKNWSGVTVAAPKDATGAPHSGPGWTLELSGGWSVIAATRPGDFELQRKP
ncbi:MAG: trypsin-like serine protease [Planctomycetota bacterium]